MKEPASGNYPVEKTIFVIAKNSSVSLNYSESKTAFVEVINQIPADYPLHKTSEVVLKTFVSSSSAILKQAESKSQNYQAQKTVQVLLKARQPASVSIPAGDNNKENVLNYHPRKTTGVFLKEVSSVSLNSPVAELKKAGVSDYPPQKTVLVPDPKSFQPTERILPSFNIDSPAIDSIKPAALKNRQPLILILTMISVVFILCTGVFGWMYWQQHAQMELLLADKQKLNALTGIKVEDIIGGGLKNNEQFAITTNQISDVKFIRICFSVNGNQYTPAGNKTIFVQLVNPENKVVFLKDKSTADINGKTIECTFKDEIMFGGEELFICRDIEKPEDLAPGNYKIEVYSEDFLKGVSSFELK